MLAIVAPVCLFILSTPEPDNSDRAASIALDCILNEYLGLRLILNVGVRGYP